MTRHYFHQNFAVCDLIVCKYKVYFYQKQAGTVSLQFEKIICNHWLQSRLVIVIGDCSPYVTLVQINRDNISAERGCNRSNTSNTRVSRRLPKFRFRVATESPSNVDNNNRRIKPFFFLTIWLVVKTLCSGCLPVFSFAHLLILLPPAAVSSSKTPNQVQFNVGRSSSSIFALLFFREPANLQLLGIT